MKVRLVGIAFALWAVLVGTAFFLAWVQTDSQLQVTLAGFGFVAGAGFIGAAITTMSRAREERCGQHQEAMNRKRGRYDRVLESTSTYNGHMREAHRYEVLKLNKEAWEHKDSMTAAGRDLEGAIELARQVAVSGSGVTVALDALESKLKGHAHWIPPDDIDPLPLEQLRDAVRQDLGG